VAVLITVITLFGVLATFYSVIYNRNEYHKAVHRQDAEQKAVRKVYKGTLEYRPEQSSTENKIQEAVDKTHPVKISYSLADDDSVEILDVIKQAELEASPDYVPPTEDRCACQVDYTCNACEFRNNYNKSVNQKPVPVAPEAQFLPAIYQHEADEIIQKMSTYIETALQEKFNNKEFGYWKDLPNGTRVSCKASVTLDQTPRLRDHLERRWS
jgi:hypothetical protein